MAPLKDGVAKPCPVLSLALGFKLQYRGRYAQLLSRFLVHTISTDLSQGLGTVSWHDLTLHLR